MAQFREDMLRDLTPGERDSLAENGYCLYRSPAVAAFREDLLAALKAISLRLLRQLHVDTARLEQLSYDDLVLWCLENEKDRQYTRLFYEMYPSMAEVIGLINHPLPLFLARAAGVRAPVPGTLPTIRIDRPLVTRYLTKSHQDYWYSLVAERSVVLWQPVSALTRDMGPLSVVPGSHKAGFQPFNDVGAYTFEMRKDFPDSDYVECEVATDEILVFSQYLVHRSGNNNGRRPRVTLQIRYNDIESMKDIAPTFTAVTSEVVKAKQQALAGGA